MPRRGAASFLRWKTRRRLGAASFLRRKTRRCLVHPLAPRLPSLGRGATSFFYWKPRQRLVLLLTRGRGATSFLRWKMKRHLVLPLKDEASPRLLAEERGSASSQRRRGAPPQTVTITLPNGNSDSKACHHEWEGQSQS
ncbi:hypothetical protein BHE74_00012471 [Ensete ventricosum]|nr:hypothetical protein BHE74_00012471 [Ensete ventricosum]